MAKNKTFLSQLGAPAEPDFLTTNKTLMMSLDSGMGFLEDRISVLSQCSMSG